MAETKNATIKSTFLGKEDHGIWTFSLRLDYSGSGQGAGGYSLDNPKRDKNDKFIGRFGTAKGMQMIMEICKIVGVDSWEDLPGKHIRVKATSTSVDEIGNLLKDEWLNFYEFMNSKEVKHED